MKYIETPRHCSECGREMHEGYCINDGDEYYCSDECLHKNYTEEEWQEIYEEDNDPDGCGSSYYTEWDD